MAIKFYTDGIDFRLPAKGRTAEWLRGVVEGAGEGAGGLFGEGRRLGAVNFIFCSRARHLEINRGFLGHDWPTDVITFDYSGEGSDAGEFSSCGATRSSPPRGVGGDEDMCRVSRQLPPLGGDIFIDPRTVAENAVRFCVAPEAEMRRVMVHGVLHLCGYGDKTPREQRLMRAKEDFYLARFYGAKV